MVCRALSSSRLPDRCHYGQYPSWPYYEPTRCKVRTCGIAHEGDGCATGRLPRIRVALLLLGHLEARDRAQDILNFVFIDTMNGLIHYSQCSLPAYTGCPRNGNL
jgi:hypothetical protein